MAGTLPEWLRKRLQREALGPMLAWGLRMGLALVVPIAWGQATGHLHEAEWIALTAEAICWVELKGTVAQRLRTVVGGMFLAVAFTTLGSITGFNLVLSLVAMLGVSFLSGLFKNLGDRGSGLAICVYVLFIIANAAPVADTAALGKRVLLVLAGGSWALVLALLFSAFMRRYEPYRRSVALIWQATGQLIAAVSKGWDGKNTRSSLREVYEKEKAVRAAIDGSVLFHEALAHQVTPKAGREYELAQLRKAASLVAAHVVAASEALEGMGLRRLENGLRLNIYALYRALQQATERLAAYVVNLLPEEELLLQSRLDRVRELAALIRDTDRTYTPDSMRRVQRVLQLSERCVRLMERSREYLEGSEGEPRSYRSYSLLKTIYVLHPRHWLRSARTLFRLNTETSRYAARMAVAATLALGIAQVLHIHHGYWLPFTVILVTQPYFGATLKKAFDRLVGTLLGGLAGGLLLRVSTGIYLKELLLFACAVLMVYYLRRRYAVAAFFITLSLVLLFAVEEEANPALILTRAASTAAGAVLAVVAGFVLLPTWDRKALPRRLAEAFGQNYCYLIETFFKPSPDAPWTRNKRLAEQANSAAFESLQRFLQEPGSGRKSYALPYQLLTHNVRLTREISQIHLEWETGEKDSQTAATESEALIRDVLKWANRTLFALRAQGQLAHVTPVPLQAAQYLPQPLSKAQTDLLERLLLELRAYTRHLEKQEALRSEQPEPPEAVEERA